MKPDKSDNSLKARAVRIQSLPTIMPLRSPSLPIRSDRL